MQVGASHFIRIRVLRDDLGQPGLDALAIHLQVLGAHDLAQQKAERHAAARRLLERLRRRQLARIRDVRPPGHIDLQLLDLFLDQRARHLERVLRDTAPRAPAPASRLRTRSFSSRVMLWRTSARRASMPPSFTPKACTNSSSTAGSPCSSTFFTSSTELGRLACQLLVGMLGREYNGDRAAFAGSGALHPLLQLRHHPVRADDEGDILALAARHRLAGHACRCSRR